MLLSMFFKRLFANRFSHSAQARFKLYGALFPLQRPIFVIGTNRSGTSVFTRYLSKSSEIVDWTEANEMWDPIGYPWEADKTHRPYWPLDPQGYTDSLVDSVGHSYFEYIPGICSMYVAAQKGIFWHARFLNKSPMNTLRVDLIHSLFPDACFISLVRDPRAVIRSWIEKIPAKLNRHPRSGVEEINGKLEVFNVDGVKYSRYDMLKSLSDSYCYIVQRQMEQLGKIPEEQKFYTSYEAFVDNLHGVLHEIDRKFGLDTDKRNWSQIPKTLENRNVKFRTEFNIAEIDLTGAQCKTVMNKLGYDIYEGLSTRETV